MIGFDLPERLNGRRRQALVSLLGRVPIAENKFWVGEELLRAADGAFLRSFAPGLLAGLLAIALDGEPHWLALSLLLLFAATGQLVVYVTVSTLTRRQLAPDTPATNTPDVSSPQTTLRRKYLVATPRRVGSISRLVRRWWVRLPFPGPADTSGPSQPSTLPDLTPFWTLSVVVVLQTLLSVCVLFVAVGLLFFTKTVR